MSGNDEQSLGIAVYCAASMGSHPDYAEAAKCTCYSNGIALHVPYMC